MVLIGYLVLHMNFEEYIEEKANSSKGEDAKLQGLKSIDYVSQLPIF